MRNVSKVWLLLLVIATTLEASGDLHTGALAALGLLLFAVTVLLNVAARLLVRMSRRGPARVQA